MPKSVKRLRIWARRWPPREPTLAIHRRCRGKTSRAIIVPLYPLPVCALRTQNSPRLILTFPAPAVARVLCRRSSAYRGTDGRISCPDHATETAADRGIPTPPPWRYAPFDPVHDENRRSDHGDNHRESKRTKMYVERRAQNLLSAVVRRIHSCRWLIGKRGRPESVDQAAL